MDSLRDIGEFGLIARLTGQHPDTSSLLVGPGDDCAVVSVGGAAWLLTIDASIEGVHFSRETASPEDIGWKAAATAASDVAAMGGTPRFMLITLACPKDTPVDLLEGINRGLAEAATACGALIAGGDVSHSPECIVIDVAAVGEVTEGRFVTRGGALPGDVIAVTGWPGRAAAGLAALDMRIQAPELIRAQLHPEPRFAAGRWLARQAAVHAMIDVSDGLVQDAGHIAARSGCTIDINMAKLPVAAALEHLRGRLLQTPEALVLGGGEDYELLAAIHADEAPALCAAFEKECGIPLTILGECRPGNTQVLVDGAALSEAGFDHFR
jgi:thiamine-monophosphate kinase